MLVQGRKRKKTRVFQKVLILGRTMFQNSFFSKKMKFRKFDFEIWFYGEKVKKMLIFYPCFVQKHPYIKNKNFVTAKPWHVDQLIT